MALRRKILSRNLWWSRGHWLGRGGLPSGDAQLALILRVAKLAFYQVLGEQFPSRPHVWLLLQRLFGGYNYGVDGCFPPSDQGPWPLMMKTQFSKIDLAALQGSWIQVDFQENGVSNPPDELGDTSRSITTFSEDRFSVRSPKGTLLLEGTFELDASCTPKAVDWIDSVWIPAWKAARLDIIAALSLR